MAEWFRKFAHRTADVVGTHWAFLIAIGVIATWALTGPFFGFSDTWQLVINTGTTINTFLMVFLIQTTQNRDARAIHLKLDELIRSHHGARNYFADLEDATEDELLRLQDEFKRLRGKGAQPHRAFEQARKTLRRTDEASPEKREPPH